MRSGLPAALDDAPGIKPALHLALRAGPASATESSTLQPPDRRMPSMLSARCCRIAACSVTLHFMTASVCAMRRLTVPLTQSGTTQKEVVESLDSPGAERQRGQQQVENATTLSKGTAERASQDSRATVRARLLEAQFPAEYLSSRRNCARHRRLPELWHVRKAVIPSAGRALANDARQGNEWATYGALGRTVKTHHGIAYPPRGARQRSLNSSRRAGKPLTWRSQAGDSTPNDEEVCEMRDADTVVGIIGESDLSHWRAVCADNVHARFGGEKWKRALPPKAPRQLPTRPLYPFLRNALRAAEIFL